MMYVALGHYNFVTIQWFPFYILFLLKTMRNGTFKYIFLTGLFAALTLYAELTFSVFLLFLTLLILINEWVAGRNYQSPLTNHLFRLVLIGAVTFILTAPFILSVLPDFLDPAFSQPGWGEGLKLSADLVGLMTLTPLHPLSGLNWITELRAVIEGTSRFTDANTLFLGYGILVVALLGYIVRRKQTQLWLWSAIFFTTLSLGPLLTINGRNRFNLDGIDATFPLPFAVLHYIPILSANRVPNRFGIPLTLSLAILVGFGVAWLLSKTKTLKTKAVVIIIPFAFLLVALLFDQYSVPIPLTDARIPEVYYQIGAESEEFTIMQLPLGWRNSYGTLGAERTQLQYYQAAHRRPMLGGNTSRNPQFKFDYFANIPLFAALTEAELYHSVDDFTLEQARQQTTELMTLYNIKYLVIHEPIPHRKPYEDTYLSTRNLALDLIPHQSKPTYQSPGVEVFAVEQAEIPNPLVIDFGNPSSVPYRGQGWADNEDIFAATANWATALEADIFFPVRNAASVNRQLSIQIAPFAYPGMPEQSVDLILNGQSLDNIFSLREDWQLIETSLPKDDLVNGLNRLTLKFAQAAEPRQVLPGNKAVGNTGIETPIDLEVNSGESFAFITTGFGETATDASAHRRGVNVAVIHPQSGEVIEFKGFDTAANEFEAAALSRFIAEISEGYIVVVATQGLDATAFFDENTLVALQSIGLTSDGLRSPFSAIGVKGAPTGMALQATGEGTAYLRLGDIPDIRPLAAAVDKVTITTPQ